MRTTVTLDDELLAQAKERAARSGRTVSQVIEEAVRDSFLRRSSTRRYLADLPTSAGSLQPGVDLSNSAELLDLMETEE